MTLPSITLDELRDAMRTMPAAEVVTLIETHLAQHCGAGA